MAETKLDYALAESTGTKLPNLRWLIIALVFLATVINFLDRMTISVLADPICKSLNLTNLQFSGITVWFLAAYTISQGLSGKIYDRIGTRRGFAMSISIWSGAAIGHAFATGLAGFSFFRVLLGFGEAGNWPGAAKVIAEWFPTRERALAMGIFNCGVAVGSVIAPPLIVFLNLSYGWKATFVVIGALGFLWLAAWLLIYLPLADHPWATQQERDYIRDGQATPQTRVTWKWSQLLTYRQVWAIVLARLLVDPVWWLYVVWLPKYLVDVRHLSMQQLGWRASIPYVTAGIGSLLGGYLSGALIRRGWSVNAARKTIIVTSMFLMPLGIMVIRAESTAEALMWICFVTFGFQVWINNVQTLPSDLFPASAVASVAGLGGVGAGIGSMIFTFTTGWVIDHFSYAPIFLAAGFLAPVGTVVLMGLVGKIRQINQ